MIPPIRPLIFPIDSNPKPRESLGLRPDDFMHHTTILGKVDTGCICFRRALRRPWNSLDKKCRLVKNSIAVKGVPG